LLELLWRPIAQCRVEPHAVIVVVDERRDVFAQVIESAVLVDVDLLSFKSFQEALAAGVVENQPARPTAISVLSRLKEATTVAVAKPCLLYSVRF
jgi:hypothetical protein